MGYGTPEELRHYPDELRHTMMSYATTPMTNVQRQTLNGKLVLLLHLNRLRFFMFGKILKLFI
jgi:hypothetical protein